MARKVEENRAEDYVTIRVTRQPGSIWELQNTGSIWILAQRGDLSQILRDAELWRLHNLELVSYCDQCDYFNTSTQAVQDHNEREHDCRFETYLTIDRYGGQRIRVRTIKCHRRVTIRAAAPRIVDGELKGALA